MLRKEKVGEVEGEMTAEIIAEGDLMGEKIVGGEMMKTEGGEKKGRRIGRGQSEGREEKKTMWKKEGPTGEIIGLAMGTTEMIAGAIFKVNDRPCR